MDYVFAKIDIGDSGVITRRADLTVSSMLCLVIVMLDFTSYK